MKRGRANIDDSAYPLFVTTTITDFIPVFRDPVLARSALELFERQRQLHDMTIYAYVLMLNHFHAIARASHRGETSRFIGAWKSLTAQIVIDSVSGEWRSAFADAARTYGEPKRKQHKVWVSRFDDVALYTPEVFGVKLEYIHGNPVRAGLVECAEDYAYSSARFCATGEGLVCSIDRLSPALGRQCCRECGRTGRSGPGSAQGLTRTEP
ncbi:MAG: hypothetical protein AB1792_05700 [Candidatus Zixiibacteriota bacterium]